MKSEILSIISLTIGIIVLFDVLTTYWRVHPVWAFIRAVLVMSSVRQIWVSLLPHSRKDFRPLIALGYALAIGLLLFFEQIAAGFLWLIHFIDSRSLRRAAGDQRLLANFGPSALFARSLLKEAV